MSETEHMGWQIESRSYETDGGRWCPRALVSRFDAGRLCRHDARALLSVTFESVRDADDYAVRVAKTWIEDTDYQPLVSWTAITPFATRPRSSRDGFGTAPIGA